MDAVASAQIPGPKVAHMDAQCRVPRRGVVSDTPFVDAPVHERRLEAKALERASYLWGV